MTSVAAPPAGRSVEDVFRPAFEEITRRAGAARALDPNDAETTHFSAAAGAPRLPLRRDDQAWVLLSMGTAVLAPRPLDPTRPALRVYGAFATREEAAEHAAEAVRPLDATCSLVVARAHEWVLMPQTEDALTDAAAAAARLERRLRAHRLRRADESDEFDRIRAARTYAEPSAAARAAAEDPDAAREQAEADAAVYRPPRRLRAGAEVRGQAAVALCTVPDETAGECLVKVLGCFESTAEADAWVRNVASRAVVEDDVLVAPTCEWLYPNARADAAASTHYRVDELQRIMDAARRNPDTVRSYREWKAEQDALRAAGGEGGALADQSAGPAPAGAASP